MLELERQFVLHDLTVVHDLLVVFDLEVLDAYSVVFFLFVDFHLRLLVPDLVIIIMLVLHFILLLDLSQVKLLHAAVIVLSFQFLDSVLRHLSLNEFTVFNNLVLMIREGLTVQGIKILLKE